MNLRFRRRAYFCPRSPNILLTAIFTVLAGCSTATVQPVPTGAPTHPWEAEELRDAIVDHQAKFQSVRALARVDYAGPEGKNSFQEVILVQRPDRLRLETLTILGAVLIVTADNKEIIGYAPRDGVYVRGQASKANLLKLTKIPIELDEMTALLLGLPPVNARASSQLDGNSLIFASSGREDRVSFESNQPIPTKWQRVDGSGAIELSAGFADHIQTPAGLFPSRIIIESPPQKKRLEIRYEQPELNVALSNDLFSLPKPPSVKEYPIEALGQ